MMNGDTFFGMMRNIYAVFNNTVPSDSSPFVMSVWERVNHVPDEAVPYIVNQIADEERMPQNVGRAILRAWESWQAHGAYPLRRVRRRWVFLVLEARREDGKVSALFVSLPGVSES